MSVTEALDFVNSLELTPREAMIAKQILKEIKSRLGFLQSVGLEYLTLARSAGTLSGGESQRIRLATQIGSSLTGVLYILDEPSIGLHQRDNDKLIATLRRLRDLGNTLIVVEHDEDTMRAADWIVDIGPGAGIHGGEVIDSGEVKGLLKCRNSITGHPARPLRQVAESHRRGGEQPPWNRRRNSARRVHLRDRSFRQRKKLPCQRDHIQAPGREAQPRPDAPRKVHRHAGRGIPG